MTVRGFQNVSLPREDEHCRKRKAADAVADTGADTGVDTVEAAHRTPA